MDKKFIQQYGEEILCYRIRTARQKKRMQYEDFDKQLIELDKEETRLFHLKWNLGWELLIPPFQRGWKRFFVLRDDVAGGRHADFFNEILKKINTYDWSHRKDFKVKSRRYGRKKYVVKEQKLLQPDEDHFKKLAFTDKEKQLFHEEIFYKQWSSKPLKRYVFNEPWRFVLRIRPNMITKVKKIDSEIESRLREIQNYIERNNYTGRMRKVSNRGGDNYWRNREFYKGYTFFPSSIQMVLNQLDDEH